MHTEAAIIEAFKIFGPLGAIRNPPSYPPPSGGYGCGKRVDIVQLAPRTEPHVDVLHK